MRRRKFYLHIVGRISVVALGRHDPKLKRPAIVGLVLPRPVAHIIRETGDEQVTERVLRRRMIVNIGKTAEDLDRIVCNLA